MTDERRYHHGDLRRALLEAGLGHARTGGPDAVVLREVARACGVTVPAVYRHYANREDFLGALAMRCQAELAGRIDGASGEATGEDLLRIIGVEYIRFAVAEPGWFATAFSVPADLTQAGHPDAAASGARTPFALVNLALDQMVEAGQVSPARREHAEVACWSNVHGLSVLATAGPLRGLPVEAVEALAASVVENAIRGVRG